MRHKSQQPSKSPRDGHSDFRSLEGEAAIRNPPPGGSAGHSDSAARRKRWSFGFRRPKGAVIVRISAAWWERWSFGYLPPGGSGGRSDFRRPEEALVVRTSAAQSGAVVIEFLPLEGRGDHSNFSGLEGTGADAAACPACPACSACPAPSGPHAGRGPRRGREPPGDDHQYAYQRAHRGQRQPRVHVVLMNMWNAAVLLAAVAVDAWPAGEARPHPAESSYRSPSRTSAPVVTWRRRGERA
jgi:hypothetical protein